MHAHTASSRGARNWPGPWRPDGAAVAQTSKAPSNERPRRAVTHRLTPRQREVLYELVERGAGNAEIGERFWAQRPYDQGPSDGCLPAAGRAQATRRSASYSPSMATGWRGNAWRGVNVRRPVDRWPRITIRLSGTPGRGGLLPTCRPSTHCWRASRRHRRDRTRTLAGADRPRLAACADNCPARAPRGPAPGGPRQARPRRPAAAAPRRLRERGVDGFVLMRTDEHGSEYLPGYAERVGLADRLHRLYAPAVVTWTPPPCSATAVTRSRSRRRSTRPCSSAGIRSTSLECLAEEHLPAGARLGYDPWLARRAERDRLEAIAGAKGGSLVALDPNPVDAIWADRLPRPIAPVRRYRGALRRRGGRRQARADRGRGRQEGGRRTPTDRRRFDCLAAQPARRHRLQSAGAELCPAVQRRDLPLVCRSASCRAA